MHKIERARPYFPKPSNRLSAQQTPVSTAQREQYPVALQLVRQHKQALQRIACKHLETLKRDTAPHGFVPYSLQKVLGLLDVLQAGSFSLHPRHRNQGEGNECGLMTRSQEHGSFDGIHLYPVREREQ